MGDSLTTSGNVFVAVADGRMYVFFANIAFLYFCFRVLLDESYSNGVIPDGIEAVS